MTKALDDSLRVYFYSSWSGQTKKGGWSFLMTRRGPEGELQRSGLSGAVSATTQQQMELIAVLEAFKRINERNLADRPITVYTSSNYINQGINDWMEGWKSKGWKGGNKKSIQNLELWQKLDKYNEQFKPSWEFITNEGEHPAFTEVKAMAAHSKKSKASR